jgi:hypothetical protein
MAQATPSRITSSPSPEAANSTTPFRQSRTFVIGAALFAVVYATVLAAAIMWWSR